MATRPFLFFLLVFSVFIQGSWQRCYDFHCDHHVDLGGCVQGYYTCSSRQFCEVTTHPSSGNAPWVDMNCRPLQDYNNCLTTQSSNPATCDPNKHDQVCNWCCLDDNCMHTLVQNGTQTTPNPGHEAVQHWSYTEQTDGVSQWSRLFPKCAGAEQSPIDLPAAQTSHDSSLEHFSLSGFNTQATECTITNNGHNVQVTIPSASQPLVTGGSLGDTYRVAQFHYHWGSTNTEGSEHTVDGRAYPMELHVVCYNTKYDGIAQSTTAMAHPDGLAVLGFFYEISPVDNPRLAPIINALSSIITSETSSTIHVSLLDLLASTDEYYRYHGSLTTPDCDQVVTWTLFRDTVPISEAQLNEFRALLDSHDHPMVHNYRNTQPLNGRTITTTAGITIG